MEKMNRSSQVKKDLVIEFLNMMLEDADIVDVDFIPTGHQKLTKRNSKAMFTFRCQCRDGDSIIIKMQIAHRHPLKVHYLLADCLKHTLDLMELAFI